MMKMLFSFDDLPRLSQRARAMLFDKVATEVVVLALRGTEAEFRDAVLSAMASRSRRLVESELSSGSNRAAARDRQGAQADRRSGAQDGAAQRNRDRAPRRHGRRITIVGRNHGRRSGFGKQDRRSDREEAQRRDRARRRSGVARGLVAGFARCDADRDRVHYPAARRPSSSARWCISSTIRRDGGSNRRATCSALAGIIVIAAVQFSAADRRADDGRRRHRVGGAEPAAHRARIGSCPISRASRSAAGLSRMFGPRGWTEFLKSVAEGRRGGRDRRQAC